LTGFCVALEPVKIADSTETGSTRKKSSMATILLPVARRATAAASTPFNHPEQPGDKFESFEIISTSNCYKRAAMMQLYSENCDFISINDILVDFLEA
jgi:hypothetical protein